MTDAYPLRWPEGWPKSRSRDDGNKFRKGHYPNYTYPTFASGRDDVVDELRKLGATNVVISSSVDIRSDGVPRSGVNPDRKYQEPGVAVYFTYKNQQTVIAQDAFTTPGVNLRSLALALEAMRAMERHGGGTMMKKAFDGFAALPPPAGSRPQRPWWDVLKYPSNPDDREFLTRREIEARAAALAEKAHPDVGGSHDLMTEINAAKEQAVADLAQTATGDDEE